MTAQSAMGASVALTSKQAMAALCDSPPSQEVEVSGAKTLLLLPMKVLV